jgi:transcriptional regulator of acetoin/glycerol metabolism
LSISDKASSNCSGAKAFGDRSRVSGFVISVIRIEQRDAVGRTGNCCRYSLTRGQDEFLLLAHFSDRAPVSAQNLTALVPDSEGRESMWQEAVCRHMLLLVALSCPPCASPATVEYFPAMCADVCGDLVGAKLRSELARCTEVCRHPDAVLVLGETGTGKELMARSLHCLWARLSEFVALNCAAVPAELLEAELFGIESGTATGVSARIGTLVQAQRGTLFLDEISEIPPPLAKQVVARSAGTGILSGGCPKTPESGCQSYCSQ